MKYITLYYQICIFMWTLLYKPKLRITSTIPGICEREALYKVRSLIDCCSLELEYET